MKKFLSIALCAVMVLGILAGCGQKGNDTPKNDNNSTALSGSVSTNGSTSMDKVIGALKEQFTADNPGVTVTYDPTGSGAGIEAVKNGSADIGLASRALKDQEKSAGLKETTVALDGIAIIVNADSKVADLTVAQIADIFTGVKTTDFDEAVKSGMIRMLGKDTDEAYLSEVIKVAVNPDCVKQVADDFKLVYTPFHGAGYRLVPEILRRLGYKHIICEPEQMKIDGDFPTVKNPNPEYKEGFTLAIELAKQNDVDLIIGTDPDADRTGIVLKDKSGEYVTLSGNQVGVLLTDYIITAKKLTNTMPAHPAVLKSIVTTEMARAAAEKNGVACFDTFTGFKFLAEKIKQFEKDGSHEYIFAFEESYGYLCGDYARDKDAVTASMLIAEMAAYYRTQGKTLYDAMEEMYEKYGYYCEQTISIVMPGVSGLQRMKELMQELRDKPLTVVGPDKVDFTRDYMPGTRTCMADGRVEQMELKGQNVMYYELEGGTTFIIRPSGTEPKVKVYIMAKGANKAEAEAKVDVLAAAAKEIVK